MNRLIFSAIGVILTFVWIIYTAPPKQEMATQGGGRIKTISRSGSTSLHKITQPINRNIELNKPRRMENLLVKSNSKASGGEKE